MIEAELVYLEKQLADPGRFINPDDVAKLVMEVRRLRQLVRLAFMEGWSQPEDEDYRPAWEESTSKGLVEA